MNLSQPYYIEKRSGAAHMDLAGEWDFTYTDAPTDPAGIEWTMKAQVPGTVYWQLYEAGVLPHPYEKNNSKLYAWVDNKVWYYRRTFTVEENRRADRAFLCLDGCAYYTRLFLNGELLGEHEGMFGGPYAEVAEKLNYGGENELVVEVKACDFGYDPGKWDSHNPDLSVKNFPIIPWNLARDRYSTPGDFIAIGPWGDIRIEFLPAYHLSRPFFQTESIDGNKVRARFEVEISDPEVDELRVPLNSTGGDGGFQFSLSVGTPGTRKDWSFVIRIRLTDRGTGEVVYDESEAYSPLDWQRSAFYENNHYQRSIVLDGIKLWQPVGLGDPIAPYYALKEAYKPLTVFVSLPYVTWAAGEDVPLTVRVVNGAGETRQRTITVRLYGPDYSELFGETREISLDGDYQTVYEFTAFRLPDAFREKFFFVEASMYEDRVLRARSFYWPKVLAAMDDSDFRAKRRDGMQPNLMFEKGPWLKRQIAEGPGTCLTASVGECRREGCRLAFRLTVKNDGPVPAFPVRPDTIDDGTVCAMEDSFFFLRPGEERVLRGDVLLRDNAPDVPTLRLTAWNAPAVEMRLI